MHDVDCKRIRNAYSRKDDRFGSFDWMNREKNRTRYFSGGEEKRTKSAKRADRVTRNNKDRGTKRTEEDWNATEGRNCTGNLKRRDRARATRQNVDQRALITRSRATRSRDTKSAIRTFLRSVLATLTCSSSRRVTLDDSACLPQKTGITYTENATDVPNKSYVRLGHVNARLRRRRSISRTPHTPPASMITTQLHVNDKHARTDYSLVCPRADWEQNRTFNGVQYPFKRRGKIIDYSRMESRASRVKGNRLSKKLEPALLSRWSMHGDRTRVKIKEKKVKMGNVVRLAWQRSRKYTHTRIRRKEKLPREGDTTPSPMRGSSATERVEANSSSRKPQAASADRRRRTNQGCPLRNYPTPKN
ncbi:hypothetical protein ANTQUA_LOCUS1102 [Anthophora quadrimaculata]